MKLRVLLMMLLAVEVDGAVIEAPSDLKCYKKSTKLDDDFTCMWRPGATDENSHFTLHYCAFHVQINRTECKQTDAGQNHFVGLVYDDLITTIRETHMWVEADTGYSKFHSANFTMVLKDQVQYDAPHIEHMSRSAGNLNLSWKSPKDERVVNEIQFRRRGDLSWQNKTLETNFEDKYNLSIQKDAVYEVRVKRRAKDLHTIIWSDWSETREVPIEIQREPEVKWQVGELRNGVRMLKLSWTAPPEEKSVGGVYYLLSLVITPCWNKPDIIKTLEKEYKIKVTASAVNVTLVAVNNVGESPKQVFTVPAQLFKNCSKDQDDRLKRKKYLKCLEWYELTGDNSTGFVNSKKTKNAAQELSEITAGLKDFARYHYFVHIRREERQTIELCHFYKTEGVPIQGPPNVTVVDVTHNSAMMSWQPIPITHLQGFLKNYVIYITSGNETNVVKISQFQTNYTIQDLTPGAHYIVNVAGETVKGVGPNTTREILLNPQLDKTGFPGLNWIIVGVIAVAAVLTIFCRYIMIRLKPKLLPDIPIPVVTEVPIKHLKVDKELYQREEELHPVVLVLDRREKRNPSPLPTEEGPLLEVCETTLCEYEGGETQIGTDEFGLSPSPNPDYKRQKLSLLAPAEITEPSHEQSDGEDTATDVYRNGLFVEFKAEDNSDTRMKPMLVL